MIDQETQQKFILRRAEGATFARLTQELSVHQWKLDQFALFLRLVHASVRMQEVLRRRSLRNLDQMAKLLRADPILASGPPGPLDLR